MKLEPKHIAPYSPYELKFLYSENTTIEIFTLNPFGAQRLNECSLNHALKDEFKIKPILRNLSDLTKEIEFNGEKFVPLDEFYKMSDYTEYIADIEEDVYELNTPKRWPYELVEKLIEWHFDIHGLIPAGLAIDINTLNK